MKNYILGIDGGGTKSHLVIFDRQGNCAAVAKYGPLNHECMAGSYAQLEPELTAFITDSLAGIGATSADVAFAVMGVAGVDTRKQHKLISAMVEKTGLSDYILCNDAFIGIPAGCPGGVGICAINGTGSTMAAIDHSGTTVQIGGIGEISSDLGGGHFYRSRMLDAVYGELYKCGAKTALTAMFLEYLGVTVADVADPADYVEALITRMEKGTLDQDALNRLPFAAAGDGDAVAIRILDDSAAHYAGGISYLATSLDFPPDKTLHVTLAGSVFTKPKVRVLPELLEKRVKERLPGRDVAFHTLSTHPVAGAVYWAGLKAGFGIEIEDVAAGIAEGGL